MNETWCRDLLALAEYRNFSRAAEKRNVTQPAFGRRIGALETWCGQALIDRASHRLTEAGEIACRAAEDLIQRTNALRNDLDALESRSSTLTVASTQTLSLTFFPRWFAQVGDGVSVHLLADNMRACERLIKEGGTQFLLCHTHAAMDFGLSEPHFRLKPLGQETLLPVAAMRDGKPLFTLETNNPPYLAFDGRSGLGRILQAVLGDRLHRLALRPVFTSHLAAALRSMALEGRGIAWLPTSLIAEDVALRRLHVLDREAMGVSVDISLVRPRARQTLLAEAFWKKI